jgi:hypothetical protein
MELLLQDLRRLKDVKVYNFDCSRKFPKPLILTLTIGQAKPRQAKVLTEGGDLLEAQVHVPLSVSHSSV